MKMKKILLIAALASLFAFNLQAAAEEALTLARDVIKASRADAMFEQMQPQFEQIFTAQLAQLPGDQQEKGKKFSKAFTDLLTKEMGSFMQKMDVIYADVFTVKELKAMKAFYESPEGSSIIEKQPQLMQKMMPIIMQMQQDMATQIQTLIKDIE